MEQRKRLEEIKGILKANKVVLSREFKVKEKGKGAPVLPHQRGEKIVSASVNEAVIERSRNIETTMPEMAKTENPKL